MATVKLDKLDGYELLTVEVVAELLQVHESTVRRLIKRGTLRSTKIGHARRVPAGALRAYLDGVEAVIPADHWPPTAPLW